MFFFGIRIGMELNFSIPKPRTAKMKLLIIQYAVPHIFPPGEFKACTACTYKSTLGIIMKRWILSLESINAANNQCTSSAAGFASELICLVRRTDTLCKPIRVTGTGSVMPRRQRCHHKCLGQYPSVQFARIMEPWICQASTAMEYTPPRRS